MRNLPNLRDFESRLRGLPVEWGTTFPKERAGEYFLLIETWNSLKSMRLEVSAYGIDPEHAGEEPIRVTIALYDRERGHMFDTWFALSYYTRALALVQNVLDETLVVQVSERAGLWSGSSLGEPQTMGSSIAGYRRSWLGTYDYGQ